MRSGSLVFLGSLLLALTCFASQVRAEPEPTRELAANIPLGPVPAGCFNNPNAAAACDNAVVYYLDQARAQIGLGPYELPANFTSLAPERQLLILTNLDRLAYGIPPVVGLAPALNAHASEGVALEADPVDPELVTYSSNWDGGVQNALFGYYAWMYDDGYGSGNIDCTTPASPGCWGHRRTIFFNFGPYPSAMGAAMGVSPGSTTMLVGTTGPGSTPALEYTWEEAVEDGAGAFVYSPGSVQALTIHSEGNGAGYVVGHSELAAVNNCESCEVTVGSEPITLTAVPSAGSVFVGWGGGCGGVAECTLSPTQATTITASFTSSRRLPLHVRLLRMRLNAAAHWVRFSFEGDPSGSAFQCALVWHSGRTVGTRFAPCRSPRTYTRLKDGLYSFYVRAIGTRGEHSSATEREFTVR